jgi:RNA polymerase sigma factor (sigma-70 family)
MSDPFMTTYKQYLPAVTRFARRLAKGDRDLADDLMQEGWVALLRLPEQRWSQESYVHTVLCRAMRRWVRREQSRAIVQVQTRHPQHQRRHREVHAGHLQLEKNQLHVDTVHSQPDECQQEVRVVHLSPDECQSEVCAVHSRPDGNPLEVGVIHLHPNERQTEAEAVQRQHRLAA